jgi:hypothetical protein
MCCLPALSDEVVRYSKMAICNKAQQKSLEAKVVNRTYYPAWIDNKIQ